MEQDIRFCTTKDGVRIAYATSGQGPPIVRVLGWFTHVEYEWENPRIRQWLEGISAHFSLTRYDGRGMGLSDRDVSDFSIAAHVSDLEAVVDALGVEKVVLYGISQGGPTAIMYALLHQERVSHLIIYGSSVRPPWSKDQSDTMLSLIRQGWGSDLPAHRQFFTSLFMPDGDMEAIEAWNEMQRMSASADTVVAMLSPRREAENEPPDPSALWLANVAVPTLVIHRRGDAIVPFELGREIAAGIPGARFLPLDGRNHALLAKSDAPVLETITKAIQEFIGAGKDTAAGANASGLVTILFTDMESSTALTQRLGDAGAQELVHTHNSVVRDALKAHDGTEIKHTGDGIMASFPSARGALDCAVAIQHGLDRGDGQVRVRIGLNAGEPVAEDDPNGRADLFGTSVQLAARVCAEAEAGEILVSNVVRELAAGKGFLFNDRGDAALGGFEDPVRLFEVSWKERA